MIASRATKLSGIILLFLCLMLPTLRFAACADEVPAILPKEEWSRFLILVRQYQTDAQRDKELYEKSGLRAFHLDQHFPSSSVEFAKANGWPYYVDHAAGRAICVFETLGKEGNSGAAGCSGPSEQFG